MGAEPGMAMVVSTHQASAVKSMDQSRLAIPSSIPTNADAKPRPSGKEVSECARKLGIDLVFDSDLLYIAEELLMSDLPPGWESFTDERGRRYYHHTEHNATQWSHPMEEYYRGLVFMRKEGELMLEEKAIESPPTPEETREMAKYFGIDPKVEVELMDIAKAAVNAPLPPEWEEYEDDDGEVYFYNMITTKTSEHHPLDGYFVELVRQRRAELQAKGAFSGYSLADYDLFDESFVPMPWMEFLDVKTGQIYFYNFMLNEVSHVHPSEITRSDLRDYAMIKLQAHIRGICVRRANRDLVYHLAATGIQRHIRGMIARKKIASEQTEEEAEAATKIQALFRGKKTRTQMDKDKEYKAAVAMQSVYRGFKARKHRRRLNKVMGAAMELLSDNEMLAAAALRNDALDALLGVAGGEGGGEGGEGGAGATAGPAREAPLLSNPRMPDFEWKASAPPPSAGGAGPKLGRPDSKKRTGSRGNGGSSSKGGGSTSRSKSIKKKG